MKIALLNAHTAYSPGAVQDLGGFPTSEYYWSNKINNELIILIRDIYPESGIIDTSGIKPYSKSLTYKAFLVKRDGYDVAIETHLNSAVTPLASGIEVLYGRGKQKSQTLASFLAKSLSHYLPFKLRHSTGIVERRNLYILKAMPCPSVIVEALFLSNKIEKVYLAHPRSAEVIANALFDGVQNYISNMGDA